MENSKVETFWDFNIQAGRMLEATKVNVNVTVLGDHKIKVKGVETLKKYTDLWNKIARIRDIQTNTIRVII